MSGRITMIGSANVDLIIQLPHLPRPGESVTGGPFTQTFGGKGSNQAVAAQRGGGEVNAVLSISADSFGKTLLETYRLEGIDTTHVVTHDDISCGTALIMIDANGQNMLGFDMAANKRLSREQAERAEQAIAASKILMMQMEIPDEPMLKAIDIAKKHGVEIMLNFAPYRETKIKLDKSIALLVVNETEAGQLLGLTVDSVDSARSAALKLAENGGHRLTIVTLGGNGSVVCENGEAIHYPAFKIDAKDATAAGDTYCGALAVALVEGKTTGEAVRFASAAGAVCASRLGAQPSIPVRADVEAFLAAQK